ncbi:MAG: carboxypeptidase-like regulatory domain-containing protein, partial [Salinimicrobium sp.]
PADLSLPDKQRFAVSLLEKDPEKLRLLLQTGYSNLMVHVAVYDNDMPLYVNYVQLKGNKVLEIPFRKTSAKELEVQVTGVKNNAALIETFRVQLPRTEDFLKITTQTFRSKLQPGTEETWSFKIENSKGETPDAEVLASMYDMSLDQFKTQEWNTKTNFSYTYRSFPSYRLPNIGGTSQLYNRFPSPWRYRPRERKFDQLRLFGFNMSNPDSYQYRRYLRSKENEKTSGELVGNTRGKVTDEEGLPLPGVNVVIEGTSTGTTTNFDGEFALDTKQGDQLVFSYVGFETERVLINNKRELYVTLTADSSALEEVVVTELAVEEEMEVVEDAESLLPLQGKVAGLSITANKTVKIRGTSSISGEGDVLFIVDGDVVTDYEIASADVLSIKVLKAEEAVALYGSRGANGVVIITTKKGMEALQNVKARKDLDETAFFFPDLRLGKDGKLEFSFTSPEALTQWKLRLLAHTKDWTTGSYQNTVRTQKELSVVPNAPRFLRETDTITFKTKISNLSSEAMTGTAMLELYDALTMKPIDSLLGNKDRLKNFSAKASGNTVVSWNLTIPEGVQAVTYRVLAKAGNFTDGEENFLPVLSNRMLVKESLPFFVRAGETETYVFKNMQENDSKTLEHHKYTLEYSSNPAWYAIQSLPYLIEFEHECSEQTFARLYANTVAGKIMNSRPKIREVFDAWQKDSSLVSDLQKREELKDLILAET